jgi:hypothetical protein
MKLHLPLILAGTVLAAQAQQGFQTPALLIEKENPRFQQVWLMAATKVQIRYREAAQAMDFKDAARGEFGGVYILEPKEVTEAFDLYESRKYKEAREAFEKIKTRFKPIQAIDNNPSTVAAFYEMECMRQMEDLEALNTALSTFMKEPLTSESQLRQLELYVLWDAARTKGWDRLEILCRERENVKLLPEQRAQVAYLHGMAFEGLNKPMEALNAYQIATTADAGASEVLARKSAIRIMEILKANPEVQHAIKVWGSQDEKKNSQGYSLLQEAGAVAVLYEMALGGGDPLPGSLKTLLQYAPKVLEIGADAPDDGEEEKESDKKEEKK